MTLFAGHIAGDVPCLLTRGRQSADSKGWGVPFPGLMRLPFTWRGQSQPCSGWDLVETLSETVTKDLPVLPVPDIYTPSVPPAELW